MKALVTGGGGFLGRYIVEQLLARGDTVRSFGRGDYPELRASGVEVIQGDLGDASAVSDACRGIDVAFHTAAIAGIWGPWEQYYRTNVQGTDHVLAACKTQGVRRLVFTSSPSVTFDGADQCGIDEAAPYAKRWLCHYPHSKALAEQMVLAANGQGGLSTCALRPHLIWGPRDTHLVPRLIARARRGQLRRIGDGSNRIDMVYVDNAAKAHLLAADRLEAGSPVAGRPYFLSQGEPVNCWDWIDQLLAIAGLPPVARSISARTAWRIGAVLEGVHRALCMSAEPRMTRFLAAQLSTSHYFDISAARRDLGYTAEVSTSEGMQRLASNIAGR